MIHRSWADPDMDPCLHDAGVAPSQLRLHEIAPVLQPSAAKLAREQVPRRPPPHASVGPRLAGNHNHTRQQTRENSVVSSAAIFSSSLKKVTQFSAETLQHPSKRKHATLTSDTTTPAHLIQALDHQHKEPIVFDPFADAPCYHWLIQDPRLSRATQQYRQDPTHLTQFREWMETHFPKVVDTLRSLQILHERTVRRPAPPPVTTSMVQQTQTPSPDKSYNHDDEDEDDDMLENLVTSEVQRRREIFCLRRQAETQAWRVLFESARLVSYLPGETICVQDLTPANDIFFVLSGHCQLLFQPKFLDVLVPQCNARKQNQSTSAHHDARTSVPHSIDVDEQFAAFSAMRRLSLSTITSAEAANVTARTMYQMRTLTAGEYFGLEACAFSFAQHTITAISQGALHRNPIGIATPGCLHVLVLSFSSLQRMREIIHHSLNPSSIMEQRETKPTEPIPAPRRCTNGKQLPSNKAPALPPLPGCRYRDEDVEFLRLTFMFQSIQLKRLEYLATQVRLVHVPEHEYLFTTGQHVAVYLVKSGQLRVTSPEQVKTHASDEDQAASFEAGCRTGGPMFTVETRNVELEILQIHDTIGLMEASLLQPTFTTNCLASSDDVSVYVIPPVALFSVLAHEPTASRHVIENLLHHHSWSNARKFTALNHHNKQTEFRLSLSTQRKSPLPCSRCGWRGHTSTSSLCVRAESVKTAFIQHLVGDDTSKLPAPPSSSKSSIAFTRDQRVAQQRVAMGNRAGSMLLLSPPRNGSMVGLVTRGNGSLLPGLQDLAAMLGVSVGNGGGGRCSPSEDTVTSELEKSLYRLDAALEGSTPSPPSRPLMQQSPRTWQRDQQLRNSVFVLRDETLRAVSRISTAVAAAASTPSQKSNATARHKVIQKGVF